MDEKTMHKGHRKRLKERFCREGLEGFSDHQVLELLLFYAIPQRDTNPLAHELIDHFGTLPQVLEAPVAELEKVKGMGNGAAILVALTTAISRYCGIRSAEQESILKTTEQCARYMIPYFKSRRDETVFLLCLDAKCKVLCCREVAKGSTNAAPVSVRKIVEMALAVNATSVMMAHNHPSGVAIPSGDDIMTTRRIAVALDAVGIVLGDHFVIADDDYVSLYASGYYHPEECRALI